MTITKKILYTIFTFVLMFIGTMFMAKASLAAPQLYFDPSTYTTSQNTDFQINLQINTDTQAAFGADAIVTFPSSGVTLKSVSNGGFFTDFSYAPSNGTIEIHGFFSAAYQSKTGSGTFATITFTPSQNSGSGTVGFTCSGSGNDTDILNSSGQNVLSCSSLNQLSLNYNVSGTTQGSNNSTNACGGTCGSNYNCNSGLFCYNGFCRNPACPSDMSCGCLATPTPIATTKPTTKPNASPSGTPVVVALATFTPYPTRTPVVQSTPKATTGPKIKIDFKTIGIIAGIILLIFAIILMFVGLIKGKSKPPKITPPTGTPTPPETEVPPVPPATPPAPPTMGPPPPTTF